MKPRIRLVSHAILLFPLLALCLPPSALGIGCRKSGQWLGVRDHTMLDVEMRVLCNRVLFFSSFAQVNGTACSVGYRSDAEGVPIHDNSFVATGSTSSVFGNFGFEFRGYFVSGTICTGVWSGVVLSGGTTCNNGGSGEGAWIATNQFPILAWPKVYELVLDEPEGQQLATLRAFRDDVLKQTSIGRDRIAALYEHAQEVASLLLEEDALRDRGADLIARLMPGIEQLNNGGRMTLSRADQQEASVVLLSLARAASPELHAFLEQAASDIQDTALLKQLGIVITP